MKPIKLSDKEIEELSDASYPGPGRFLDLVLYVESLLARKVEEAIRHELLELLNEAEMTGQVDITEEKLHKLAELVINHCVTIDSEDWKVATLRIR